MISNDTKKTLNKLIKQYDNILLFYHTNPDGDCVGTSFGLAQALTDTYPNKNIKVVTSGEDVKQNLKYLNTFINWDLITETKPDGKYLAIIGDVSGKARVKHFEEFIPQASDVFCFDHHTNKIDFEHTLLWSEPNYPAASIMAFEIAEALSLKITSESSLLIHNGIISDTGFYKFSFTNPLPLSTSAKLLKFVDQNSLKLLYKKITEKTSQEIKFMTFVLQNYDHISTKNGNIIWKKITLKDQKTIGIKTPAEAARVNILEIIENSEVWMFFIEYSETHIRVEFRSRNVKVNEIAAMFNGGGHENASGCIINSFDEVDKIIKVVKDRVESL